MLLVYVIGLLNAFDVVVSRVFEYLFFIFL